MYCINCGVKLIEEAKFCYACGHQRVTVTAEQSPVPGQAVGTNIMGDTTPPTVLSGADDPLTHNSAVPAAVPEPAPPVQSSEQFPAILAEEYPSDSFGASPTAQSPSAQSPTAQSPSAAPVAMPRSSSVYVEAPQVVEERAPIDSATGDSAADERPAEVVSADDVWGFDAQVPDHHDELSATSTLNTVLVEPTDDAASAAPGGGYGGEISNSPDRSSQATQAWQFQPEVDDASGISPFVESDWNEVPSTHPNQSGGAGPNAYAPFATAVQPVYADHQAQLGNPTMADTPAVRTGFASGVGTGASDGVGTADYRPQWVVAPSEGAAPAPAVSSGMTNKPTYNSARIKPRSLVPMGLICAWLMFGGFAYMGVTAFTTDLPAVVHEAADDFVPTAIAWDIVRDPLSSPMTVRLKFASVAIALFATVPTLISVLVGSRRSAGGFGLVVSLGLLGGAAFRLYHTLDDGLFRFIGAGDALRSIALPLVMMALFGLVVFALAIRLSKSPKPIPLA